MKIRLLQCVGLLVGLESSPGLLCVLDVNLKDIDWQIKALNTSVEAGIVELIRPDTSYD